MAEEQEAQRLIKDGYHQVSRKFQILARLPPGVTAVKALARASRDPKLAKRLGQQGTAAGYFMRVYARYEKLTVDVSPEVFRAFKRLGGPVA